MQQKKMRRREVDAEPGERTSALRGDGSRGRGESMRK
jgi:hypothetical protein